MKKDKYPIILDTEQLAMIIIALKDEINDIKKLDVEGNELIEEYQEVYDYVSDPCNRKNL